MFIILSLDQKIAVFVWTFCFFRVKYLGILQKLLDMTLSVLFY